MPEPVETYEHKGVRVNIYYDTHGFNPREDCTRGTTILAWHRRSHLGDEGFNYRDLPNFDSAREVEAWLRSEHGALVVKPLYLYEHSGMTVSLKPFSCPWDSGQVGYVFVTQKHVDDTGGDPDQMIEADVKEYDSFLRGEVYGYIVDEDGPHADSCWGFIGDLDYVKSEANAQADYIARKRVEEAEEAAHWAARDVVTT